ncbi:SDR family oxidoreductase [Ornithinimicrobium murale]|uniref:SDR family oxidoreductase n=1 Tax=Ornithinimicrobium murale TaxID=1050153 RepID=UPI001EDF8121|nr:SDR family oxidoreductase [Ornithinimicrobium murale]
MRRFENAVAVITGASRGIGMGIAERLVAEGARVVITARGEGTLAESIAHLGGPSVAIGVSGKSDDPEHRRQVIQTAVEQFGSVDLLVNNVGINPVYGPLMELDLDAARKTVEVNCLSAISWVKLAVEHGLSAPHAAVLNVASVAGVRAAPGIAFYGATKAMLIHLTTELAVELAPRIRVNALAPALVKTRFASALLEGREEHVVRDYPMGRIAEPSDIAGPAAFLLSSDAAWVTGQTLVVDGGLMLSSGI